MAGQRIKCVSQRGNGCGIACVAMLASVTFDEAAAAFPPGTEDKGAFAEHVIAALSEFDIKAASLKPLAGDAYLSLESDAVLRGEFKEPRQKRDWHWVVWDAKRRKLLDPYRPKHTFRCTSFLKILHRSVA